MKPSPLNSTKTSKLGSSLPLPEITGSQTVGVSAPKPSEDAIKKRCTPTAFLIYNLTPEQQTLLLRRRVWSSLAITFHVTDLSPQCPGFIFSIKGFSTLIDTGIWDIVERVWSDDQTHAFIATLTGTLPDDVRQEAYRSAHAFLASLHISRLDVRDAGDTLVPRFNVYGIGSTIQNDDVWVGLRDYLATRTYSSPMLGRGFVDPRPYHCGICHGIDHPRGLCPFPVIEGWNGPKRRHNNRGGGDWPRGMAMRGRSNRF
ncbi:hypothetical protein EDB87DRAFT_1568627 [Lactarius vividus]|nr:hypothetical protein EDB87DRAFT_1568627 [Lactarius vividus]